MRKLNNTNLLQKDGGLLSSLQCNALASLIHFAHNAQSELGMQVHCIGDQRGGPPSFCSMVVFLSFSSLPCFCPFTGPALTWDEAFSETFSSSCFWSQRNRVQMIHVQPQPPIFISLPWLSQKRITIWLQKYVAIITKHGFVVASHILYLCHIAHITLYAYTPLLIRLKYFLALCLQ